MVNSRLAATGMAWLAVLIAGPARAETARIQIMSDQLRAAPLTAAAGVGAVDAGTDADFEEPAIISFGRAADIAGVPIDYAHYRPAARPGAAGAASKSGRAARFAGYAGYAGPLAWPSRLPLAAAALTSGFGGRIHPILGTWRQHSGVDLAAATGTPVYAPSPGKVVAAQWWGGYGLLVAVDHGQGMQTRYGHLSQLAVYPGQQIAAGQVLGYVGSTGNSTGPHLHYEMRLNGQPLDPLQATGKR